MAQINKIRSVKGELTADTTEIQRIIKDYQRYLHANKMNNLEETDKPLERHNLPKLNQEDLENMNKPNRSTENETDFKNHNKRKFRFKWLPR